MPWRAGPQTSRITAITTCGPVVPFRVVGVELPDAPGAAEQEPAEDEQERAGTFTGYRAPLVDGMSVTRGSIATAGRSARASALNWPSTMWWASRPA